jgi:iron complex transport system substrate-binding protein
LGRRHPPNPYNDRADFASLGLFNAMASDPRPGETLVEAALAGDDDAYRELTIRHKERVFGVASRFACDAAELEDICQEVFVQAYFKLRQYRRDSPFEHWLLRIATHKCYDYLRKRRRSAPTASVESMLESGYDPAAPEPAIYHPNMERLHAALAALSPKERLVITPLGLEDRRVQELAELTRVEDRKGGFRAEDSESSEGEFRFFIRDLCIHRVDSIFMNPNEVTASIVDAAYHIHRDVGPGCLESVYEILLANALQRKGLRVVRQMPIPIRFDGQIFDEGFRADLVVEDLVIVEIKSVDQLARVHKKQLLTYLKLSGLQIGLLINFGGDLLKGNIERLVANKAPNLER